MRQLAVEKEMLDHRKQSIFKHETRLCYKPHQLLTVERRETTVFSILAHFIDIREVNHAAGHVAGEKRKA